MKIPRLTPVSERVLPLSRLAAMALIGSLAMLAQAAAHECGTVDEALGRISVALRAGQWDQWKALRDLQRKHPRCDDGGVAEGHSDIVCRILSGGWSTLGELDRMLKTDPDFEKFVLKHIDTTCGDRDLARLGENARERCPAGNESLCRAIAKPGSRRDRLEPQMTIVGLRLEESTLANAALSLGETEIKHNGGDAAASAVAMCYVGADGTGLVFTSSSEMEGGEKIGGYQLLARQELADFGLGDYRPPLEKRPSCSLLRSLSRAMATGGGLHLGMSEAEVRDALGPPRKRHSGLLIYESLLALPDGLSLLRTVRIDLEQGSVAAIRATQVTSR